MTPTRRAVLGGLLAAPWAARARASEASLLDRVPGWARIRLAVPNDPATGYADLRTIAANAHGYVSENLTKPKFLSLGSGSELAPFERQRAALASAGGAGPWDLHGALWHRSMGDALPGALRDAPGRAQALSVEILEAAFARHPFAAFDVNEVQRATRPADAAHDRWRGPVRDLPEGPGLGPNGSPWYEATARAGAWPHGPGHWWLAAARWARETGRRLVYNDFGLEAGRPWGAGGAVPEGLEAAAGETLKRRRVLDAVNYALAHGGRIDAVGLQAHLDPRRAIDAADLGAFLASLRSMGVGVEVTELDVAPHPLAPAYAGRWLAEALAASPLHRVGGWTGWAPPGEPRRLTMVDRSGVAPLGAAVARALSEADPPDARRRPPASRFYGLTHGVTGDLWRAARDPQAPGFEAEGDAAGTAVRPGSGGAALPLTQDGARPGGPVAPVWRDGRANPSAMALAFQWEGGARDGPRLTLTSRGRAVLTIGRAGGVLVAGATPLGPEPPGAARVALSWRGGVLVALADGGPAVALALDAVPDAAVAMGDGRSEGAARATLMTLWRDPVSEAELRRHAAPQGARFLARDDLAAGTPR